MKKIKEYIKDNKFYLLVMSIFTIAFSLIVSRVVLYADDFGLYAKALTYDIDVVINEFTYIYQNWGGGPTPGFAVITLMIGLTFWKICNVLMIFLIIHMMLNMIFNKGQNDDKKRAIIAAIMWSFIMLLNLSVARETLYWFDGSMAYVLPTFLAISYIYYCYKYIIKNNNVKWWNYITLPLLGFFAGWNSPQAGAITVLIGILFLIYQKFIQKEKINKLVLIANIFVLIGFCILYFAPGNASRMSAFPEYNSLNLIGKIFYRLDDVSNLITNNHLYSHFNLPTYLYFMAIILIGYIISLIKKKDIKRHKLLDLSLGIIISYVVLHYVYSISDPGDCLYDFLNILFNYSTNFKIGLYFTFQIIISYIYFILFIISILYLAYLIMLDKKSPILLFSLISGIGTQIVMVMAPYSPARSTLISIIFMIFAIAILLYYFKDYKILCLTIICCLYFYNVDYAMFITLLYLLFNMLINDSNYINIVLTCILFPTIAITFATYNGYSEAYYTHKENDRLIEQYIDDGNEGVLELCQIKNESYSFTPIYSDADWIRADVINLYDLNENVEIKTKLCSE